MQMFISRIIVNQEGEAIIPPGPEHLRRAQKPEELFFFAEHEICGGNVEVRMVTSGKCVLHCRSCGLRVLIPIEVNSWGSAQLYFQRLLPSTATKENLLNRSLDDVEYLTTKDRKKLQKAGVTQIGQLVQLGKYNLEFRLRIGKRANDWLQEGLQKEGLDLYMTLPKDVADQFPLPQKLQKKPPKGFEETDNIPPSP